MGLIKVLSQHSHYITSFSRLLKILDSRPAMTSLILIYFNTWSPNPERHAGCFSTLLFPNEYPLALQLCRKLSALLSCICCHQIHQYRAQHIIRLQSNALELLPDLIDPLGVESLLDNAAHKRRKLRLLPPLGVAQLRVHKVEALEWMVRYNTAVQMDTALFASIALDGC